MKLMVGVGANVGPLVEGRVRLASGPRLPGHR